MGLRVAIGVCLVFGLSGCSLNTLPERLGTMKNPRPVLGDYVENEFVTSNYQVLLNATKGATDDPSVLQNQITPRQVELYLDRGFALADFYCEDFFRDAEESQRRRQYGRAITNDVGTAMATILGLANAGQDVVAGVATGVGLADSTWRNYDEAFVVSPDLSAVKSLVEAAQDVFRQKTSANLPNNYGKAQSVILRYSNICSTLGMKSLLTQSADQQRKELNDIVDPPVAGASDPRAAPVAIPN
jgi:hypothetical protein